MSVRDALNSRAQSIGFALVTPRLNAAPVIHEQLLGEAWRLGYPLLIEPCGELRIYIARSIKDLKSLHRDVLAYSEYDLKRPPMNTRVVRVDLREPELYVEITDIVFGLSKDVPKVTRDPEEEVERLSRGLARSLPSLNGVLQLLVASDKIYLLGIENPP